MATKEKCPECGLAFSSDAPGGICPKCLLKLGLKPGAESTTTDVNVVELNPAARPQRPERIGPYRILEPIGEGGMGDVYLAEQQTPIHRRVAIKIIKLGMDTRQVVARFESERQALALMEHPNIAGVLDAGEYDGRPYFVMEYVPGVPITEYCDRHRLSTRERLDIFKLVCNAIQHAHQKGIIHRDIKPHNVLVAYHDGKAVPKVIDFGVAKATCQRLTEKTLYTQYGLLIGTPEYMSPEQADLTGLDVDTRTDIYSLGVLLYELLTGVLPFDPKALRSAGFEEVRRMIREDDPQKPTTKLNSLGDTAADIALHRRTDVKTLNRQLKGDLEWITLKALEKDRARRYPSASAIAADVDRHLNHDPVVAGPPSRVYRFGKFVRKHRGPIAATASVVATALVLGAAAIGLGIEALRNQEAAVAARSEVESVRDVADAEAAMANGTRMLLEIDEHVEAEEWEEAFALANEVVAVYGSIAELMTQLDTRWPRFSSEVPISSEPAGAAVYRRPYALSDSGWKQLAVTPVRAVRLPFGVSALRFEKDGYENSLTTAYGGSNANLRRGAEPGRPVMVRLDREGSLPAGMVRVSSQIGFIQGQPLTFNPGLVRGSDFYLARYEVTNREFKKFVDQGGYGKREYWQFPFVRDGRTLSFEEAMGELVDKTERPGPKTWEFGSYPDGRGDYPVTGVSWYEAAAYAEFAGAELPTVHHWRMAFDSSETELAWLLQSSNLQGEALAPVGRFDGLSRSGTWDMAGNAREWTANADAGGDRRFILGGGWRDPHHVAYGFALADSVASAFDRSDSNGIRLAVSNDDDASASAARAPIAIVSRLAMFDKAPISDATFETYKSFYDYDHTELNATVHEDETVVAPHWRRERVSIDTAYGERMDLYLYLPTSSDGPYQTILYWAGASMRVAGSYTRYPFQLDFLMRDGRAVVAPILYQTFDRNTLPWPERASNEHRDEVIKWIQDVRRTIDYLETRPDIDSERLGMFGYSWGAANAPLALALEPRLRAAVLYAAGVQQETKPEASPVTFLPRVTAPVLMIAGALDTLMPYEDVAKPFFDRLGAPTPDKKLIVIPASHYPPVAQLIAPTLEWLDEHLGPVQ